MRRIIERKSYDTETATLLSYNGILNRNSCTRSTDLFKTKKGNYFFFHQTMWQGKYDHIQPIDEEGAMDFHENAQNIEIDFEDAFPDIKIEEA